MPEIDARAALYLEVQQFYAAHMHALDDGDAARWAEDFTEDAVFVPPAGEPVRGRSALHEAVAGSARERARIGEQHRHWHGMVDVDERDGEIAVRCYALIVVTPRGGATRLNRSCVCRDRLVRVDGRLRVLERHVTRDDMAPTDTPSMEPAAG